MKFILPLAFFLAATSAHALAPAVNGGALVDGAALVEADVSIKRSDVIASAKPTGRRTANQKHESIRNLTVRTAVQTPSTWQFGAEIQAADRVKQGADATSLSELNFNGGVRTGPVLTYAQVTVPVSRSAYEKEDQYQLDALGRGFWAVGVGQY